MNRHRSPLPVIVILAAGRSSRFGRPKGLARIRGRSLLRRLAEQLSRMDHAGVRIVLAPRSPLRRAAQAAGWVCLTNRRRDEGLSSSIACAALHTRVAGALLFLPLDMPALDGRDLQRLLQRWRAGRRRVVARSLQGRPAIPLILPRWLFGLTRQARGDTGLRPLLATLDSDALRLVDLPHAALDVDTPADLSAARRMLRRQPCTSR